MSDAAFWWLLGFAVVATSVVSGVVGMAGGMLLLSIMLLRLEPVVAIPIHAAIQLVSNASRAWFQRKHVAWRPVLLFALPLLPASFLGVYVLRVLPEAVALIAVAAFVIGSLWFPSLFGVLTKPRGDGSRGLLLGGALVGLLSPVLGATGPLLAPFVLALELGPQATIGTLAACQIFQHSSKLLAFGTTGFDFAAYAVPVACLSLAAVLGSAIGARALDRVDARTFKVAVRWVLTLLALKLGVDGAVGLLP